jgi:hypothetical protein
VFFAGVNGNFRNYLNVLIIRKIGGGTYESKNASRINVHADCVGAIVNSCGSVAYKGVCRTGV